MFYLTLESTEPARKQSYDSTPFITRTRALEYLQRKRRSYKNFQSIDHECEEHDCTQGEVKEWCIDGCYEENRGYCEKGKAKRCAVGY